MYQIFRVVNHRLGQSNQPEYTVVEGRFFPTVAHPRGWSDQFEYELHNDGKIYRSAQHPLGAGSRPDYEIGADCMLYRTVHHPEGSASAPEYELREMAR
jgi:hypothetical protein